MTEEDCLSNPKIEVTVTHCYECHIYVRNADQNRLQTVIISHNSCNNFPVMRNIVIPIYMHHIYHVVYTLTAIKGLFHYGLASVPTLFWT